MASIFTKIVNGEVPCYKIAENEQFIAFLDVFPVVKGHVLVVPKKETDYIFDVSDEELSNILTFAKPIAKAIEKVVPCKRIGISVIGLEVPHAHVHLVPMNSLGDMDFRKKLTPNLSKEEFETLATEIRSNL
jgi:histidine triad (HIT) family protein